MARRKAFTLIELLVVIVVIILLAGLLIPVIGIVRSSAQNARSQQQITNLSKAIETYYQMSNAYPGPLTFNAIRRPFVLLDPNNAASPHLKNMGGTDIANITMSENLAVGLVGGLKFDPSLAPNQFRFDPSVIGKGPKNLNTMVQARSQVSAFIEVKPGDLSGGKYADSEGSADDSEIPEFLDGFPNGMPVLYLRARAGAAPGMPWNKSWNPIVTDGMNPLPEQRPGQYDITQIIGYTGTSIGVGKAEDLKRKYKPNTGVLAFPAHGLQTVTYNATLTSQYPFDAYPYFKHPSIVDTARQKDGYILIGAGKDRIYGTEDDITNFGSVAP